MKQTNAGTSESGIIFMRMSKLTVPFCWRLNRTDPRLPQWLDDHLAIRCLASRYHALLNWTIP
eukprot:762422-Hanusia_phi.AAC.6